MWWLALWFSSVPMIMPQVPDTLAIDGSAYIVAVGTGETVMAAFNSLDFDAAFDLAQSTNTDFYYKFFRMKEQSVTFNPDGTARLRLRASSAPVFPVIWNTREPIISLSTSAHYSIAASSTALMSQVEARHGVSGEQVKVFWGDEWKLEPQLWVRPK